MNASSPSLLIPLVETGSRPPFFIVPGAGSTAFSLVRLARCLESERPVYTFEFPGIENGQGHHSSVEAMALDYVAEIRSVQKSGPYYIGGHCWGGNVACAIASELEAAGDTVAVLALLESFPPEIDKPIPGPAGTDAPNSSLVVRDETNRAVALALKQLRTSIERLPSALAERFEQLTREQTLMSSRYRACAIDAPITLLCTRIHPGIVYQAWESLSTQGFTRRIVSGDAYTMLIPPEVGFIAAQLGTVLDAH